MATGVRIRGASGNLQISENAPTYMIVAKGSFDAGSKVNADGGAGAYPKYVFSQRFSLPFPITTQEPPMIFMRFHNECGITGFSLIGGPGAWTGIHLNSGLPGRPDAPCIGDYFVAVAQVAPSTSSRVGMRIRNRNTNVVIYDSGYPLVKFSANIVQFVKEYSSYWQMNMYAGVKQPGTYMLMNTLTGFIANEGNWPNEPADFVWLMFHPNEPSRFWMTTQKSGYDDQLFNDYIWAVVTANPGL